MPNDAEAYQHSLQALHDCLTPSGFIASPLDIDNYARVWARDGVIDGLAALASGDATLVGGMQRTLETLARHQGPHGEIPSNVSLDGSKVSYGYLVGRVDALLWYVIGACAYLRYTSEGEIRAFARPVVERALFLAGCWEYNNRGLIYTPLSGNWADEYIQQGYVLSDQLLYLAALSGAGQVFDRSDWLEKATHLRQVLAVNFWPKASIQNDALVYHPYAYRYRLERQEVVEHWQPAFSPSGYTTCFDGLAHALALLTGLGDDGQREQAETYVQSLESEIGCAVLPAFWPVIKPGDAGWAELQANHLFGEMKNQPYHYHNGGLWPVLTGLYALGLMRYGWHERAQHLLEAINAANAPQRQDGEWVFPEFLHGQTRAKMGTQPLAWSAAAGVLAHQAVTRRVIPIVL